MRPHSSERQPTRSFDGRAVDYERGRPGYPGAALDRLLEGLSSGSSPRVADVGAGTGRLSRALAARGCRVLAVEPNAEMRAAAPPMEGVEWSAGTAEATGLDTGTCALACVAQAFHWFEPARALPELRRILVPSGRLAVLWNDRRVESGFERAYDQLVRSLKPPARGGRPPKDAGDALNDTPWFEEPRLIHFDFVHRVDAETLVARTASLSYAPREPARRGEWEGELRRLHAAAVEKDGRVPLGYLTQVHLTQSRS